MWKILCCGFLGLSVLGGAAQAQTGYYVPTPYGTLIRIPPTQRLPANKPKSTSVSPPLLQQAPPSLPEMRLAFMLPEPSAEQEPELIPEPDIEVHEEEAPFEVSDGNGYSASNKVMLFLRFEEWLRDPKNYDWESSRRSAMASIR